MSAALNPSGIANDVDVATSLAISRATSRVVSRLSADAQSALARELAREAEVQELHGGPVGELVAALIGAFASELG
jgi:hypothetical protein